MPRCNTEQCPSDFSSDTPTTTPITFSKPLSEKLEGELSGLIRDIKKIRKDSAITQRQLAEKSGIAYQNISRLERQGAVPTLRLFVRYAYALGYCLKLTKISEDEERNEDGNI